ncbi:hypothetical protein DWB64_10815 [Fusibacter sp. A1]|nr:hypothetical protein DWB64_10815 [Fusibacter sp. A1]
MHHSIHFCILGSNMKNKLITTSFITMLILVFILNAVSPDHGLSVSERRKLKYFSDLDLSKVLSGGFIEDFEKVALDQFIFRDTYRRVKAFVAFNLFNKSDNNDIAVIEDQIFKMEYPLNQKQVLAFSEYINKVSALYLTDNDVYYAIIPDKNYFLTDSDNLLRLDYDYLEQLVIKNVKGMTYINLFDVLTLSDYYRTDPHWKQENLLPVLIRLKEAMKLDTDFEDINYAIEEYSSFYGAYYGQAALSASPDHLKYLTNTIIQHAIVRNMESENQSDADVYDTQKLVGLDAYDVFLSGASPLITIESKVGDSEKELIIFRDSFASSLTPLLIEEYKKITLIDTRYVSHSSIGDYVDFEGADVLFLYNTSVINHSQILK